MSISEGLTVLDGWCALYGAKANGWLNFQDKDVDIDSCIDMQEYLHYDNPLNGFLHVIVPSRLIAIKRPMDLSKISSEASRPWADLDGRQTILQSRVLRRYPWTRLRGASPCSLRQ